MTGRPQPVAGGTAQMSVAVEVRPAAGVAAQMSVELDGGGSVVLDGDAGVVGVRDAWCTGVFPAVQPAGVFPAVQPAGVFPVVQPAGVFPAMQPALLTMKTGAEHTLPPDVGWYGAVYCCRGTQPTMGNAQPDSVSRAIAFAVLRYKKTSPTLATSTHPGAGV